MLMGGMLCWMAGVCLLGGGCRGVEGEDWFSIP